ncbi:hypothetical protein SB748_36170, partial [Rhizobium sp. SIMBA_035]
MLWIDGRCGTIPDVLEQAVAVLENRSEGHPATNIAKARHRLQLSRYEYRTFIGDYASVVESLEDEFANGPG